MTTRRYGDDEANEIFRLATTGGAGDRPIPAEAGGLTLDQLQHIGREAGIEPAHIAQAAASLDARTTPAPVRRSFGLPVGLTRVVDLPRAPTDREWERLISEFRTTFGAKGRSTTSGGLREWSHGTLHICVEPTEHGEQLRLSAFKEEGIIVNGLSLVMGGMSVLMSAVLAAGGHPEKALAILGMLGGTAVAAFGANRVLMPRWARDREREMGAVVEHAVELLSHPASQSASDSSRGDG